ncbi:MAG: polyprenyl synthetase family protein [Clostridiales bacterium]|jgi:geranylgeranyl diphosphate synthase type II|nr:polyprenyl synthetase family protein [Clostridiales bacterium]
MKPLEQRLTWCASFIEEALERRLSGNILAMESPMTQAMRYAVLGGGKRIRAFLTIEFCCMFGGVPEDAADYACAMEMVHGYSLVHDDLPCMDNDDMRRGMPSCHKKFGETVALLAGDALLTQAFYCIGNHDAKESYAANSLAVRALSRCAGALGMCAGQQMDLAMDAQDYDTLKTLHRLKTGALMEAACLLGFYAAKGEPDVNIEKNLETYAQNLGLAFQIIDDLLDVNSTEEVLGKPVGSDAKNGKCTVLKFLTEEEAFEEARRLSQEASALFADYKNSDSICQLPMYLLNRKK